MCIKHIRIRGINTVVFILPGEPGRGEQLIIKWRERGRGSNLTGFPGSRIVGQRQENH